MYIDEEFLKLYEELIQNNIIELILNENEIFLMKLNYKYIKENKDEDLNSRNKKLSEAYQKCGYSDRRLQCSSICHIFSRIHDKIYYYISLYGKDGLIKICKSNGFNKDNLQNQDAIIKFIINHNIMIEESATLSSTIEKKKRQMILFGENIPFIPLSSIGISKKYLNALEHSDIKTVADVCEKVNHYSCFKNVRGFGPIGFEELVECIHNSGFLFIDEDKHLCDNEEICYKAK